MKKTLALIGAMLPAFAFAAATPSNTAIKTARYAAATYNKAMVDSLAKMVRFNTVADPSVAFEQNPQQIGFKQLLQDEARRLGFEFEDYGHVLRIAYGKGTERVGIVTHGDVQPVDPSKWKKSPFELDRSSEPGKLIARGSEDDKGPIASALYAMKAIKDRKLALKKRIELYVYLAEESDWEPLVAFLKTHTPPQLNITLDSEYPAVVAEKGWGNIALSFGAQAAPAPGQPSLAAFGGGFFASQIPEDANAVVADATPALEAAIRARGAAQAGVQYSYAWEGKNLKVTARGKAAHSSKPEDGVNAIAMLADALAVQAWPDTQAGALVNFLNEMVGTGLYGERLGKAAYSDSFMGPMTVAPTVIKQADGTTVLTLNVRRPRGKPQAQLVEEMQAAIDAWQARHVKLANVKLDIGDPWIQQDAPQLDTLLGVYAHYTGQRDAKAVSIGGGTNSRLFPKAVSFGPAMPGMVYTGHSEHEFITAKQLRMNLEMYTAVLVELAR